MRKRLSQKKKKKKKINVLCLIKYIACPKADRHEKPSHGEAESDL